MGNTSYRKTVKSESIPETMYMDTEKKAMKDDLHEPSRLNKGVGGNMRLDLYKGYVQNDTNVIKAVRNTKVIINNGFCEGSSEENKGTVSFHKKTGDTSTKGSPMVDDAKLFLHFIKRVKRLDDNNMYSKYENSNNSDVETFSTVKLSPIKIESAYEYVSNNPVVPCQNNGNGVKVTLCDSSDMMSIVDSRRRVINFPIEERKVEVNNEIKDGESVVTDIEKSMLAKQYSYTAQDQRMPSENMRTDGDMLSEMLSESAHTKVEHAKRKNDPKSVFNVDSSSTVTARRRVK